MTETSHNVVKSEQVIGKKVTNSANDDLGKIKEIIIDKYSGRVAYLVLETGSFLGLGGKLFALPWNAVTYNKEKDSLILNIDKEKLKNAPGFDKDHWPDMADRQFGNTISSYYGTKPYWE